MSAATIIHRPASEQYLPPESDAAQRHEHLEGEVIAMAGGSRAHNLLTAHVARVIGNHLEGSPRRVYESKMQLLVDRADRFLRSRRYALTIRFACLRW
jgi:hypothetical protein